MYSNATLSSVISNSPCYKSTVVTLKPSISDKKNILLFFLILGICFTVSPQNSTITGIIVEKESMIKVVDAIVAIEGTTFVESTDANGQFTFNGDIPKKEFVVSVSKEGYDERYFLINVVLGKKLIVDDVQLEVTKKEKKRRKKLRKSAQKEGEKQDKRVAKEKKKLKKDKKGPLSIFKKDKEVVDIVYEDLRVQNNDITEKEGVITPLQKKYAKILSITPEEITNTELYTFIDGWMGTPYQLGGDTKPGIDCSSFTQRLFLKVYGELIERTAQNQMDSEVTKTFAGMQFLEEGDLVFFRARGDIGDTITHVGVYLSENKFVNATSRRGKSGSSGVKISDLSDPFWTKRFFAGGRRVITEN